MLQRAASNAYSWWWASHIRTKQSKWMEQNLQDMEEKVQYVLKLIDEDGDSFARRAEMYYKKRPELISFIEESYRAYRALAERYDHISTELQNANNTIASVLPEQAQFAMEEDDGEKDSNPQFPERPSDSARANIPKVPTKAPKEVKKAWRSDNNKKLRSRIVHPVAKSGLTSSEGLEEIDRLQRKILALQTEKEFVKSSYECQLARYWEIDNEIEEMQEMVCGLQDEFGAGTVIEDDEARKLMASAALKSCHDTLSELEKKHEKSAQEAKVEHIRIADAQDKLNSLSVELLDENQAEELKISQEPKERKDTGSRSVTVTEFAEQIDVLVNKVIDLEASVSLQAGLIQRMRTETNELQTQIGILESDKAILIEGKNEQREKLREMEEKLLGLQELDRNVESQNKNLQTHFSEANRNLNQLNEKLHTVKPDEEQNSLLKKTESESLQKEKESHDEIEDEPDWKRLYKEGMTEREKFLLDEYTKVLRNYKEAKKQLSETSNKKSDGLFDTIQVDDKLLLLEGLEISPVEQKFRAGIDELLEENLDFWLRFSSTFHQIQKFKTEIKDLQSELEKLEEKQKKQESNLRSDAKPLYKHLREIQTELSVWLETGEQLKDEVKRRFSSLCDIQEEITAALKESAEDEDFKFTSYQAAKFQGEILNMKQENNKVADELQAGLDHVTTLQLELEKTLAKLDEEYELSGMKDRLNVQLPHAESRSRIPLRSFIFGIKPKKQKHSIFSPLQKRYNGLKSGVNL